MTEGQLNVVSAIASALGALAAGGASIVLAKLTAKYVRLTSHLVDEARAARAPEVVVDVQFDAMPPRFVVANRGATPAYDVRIKVAQRNVAWRDPKGDIKLEQLAPIKKGVSFIPSGRTMRYMIGMLDWEKTIKNDASLDFEVAYQDDRGATMRREYSIELAAFEYMLLEGGQRQSFEVIADAIRRAAEHVKPPKFMLTPTRACPTCGETIKAQARKCPHCLEPVPEQLKDEPGATPS